MFFCGKKFDQDCSQIVDQARPDTPKESSEELQDDREQGPDAHHKQNKVLDTQDLDEHVLGCNTPGHTTTVTLQGGPHPGKENLHQTKPIVRALFLSIEMKIPLQISKHCKYC